MTSPVATAPPYGLQYGRCPSHKDIPSNTPVSGLITGPASKRPVSRDGKRKEKPPDQAFQGTPSS